MIAQSLIDSVLASVNLPDYIGEQMPLAQRSGTHEGLCPFHDEQTPSFKVFHDHYHCFGCGTHGNAIEFTMARQGMSFPEAVRCLAARSGIAIPDETRERQIPSGMERQLETLRRACAEYQRLLLSNTGVTGMDELGARAIDADTIMRFGIGYAPEAWNTLTDDRSFGWDGLLEVGLAVRKREKKGCYDFFRNRLLFPVRDIDGNVVGFGGRRLGTEGPKYLNTPETALYQKGRVLFGLQQARAAIRQEQAAIVCEGFFDVVTPSQNGIENIVSTCGTALTEPQIELLLSLADKVVLCFDGDSAGAKATWRAAELLTSFVSDHHEVRLCRMPGGHDPDSLVREQGPDAFRSLIDQAPTLTAYLVDAVVRGSRIPEARARSLSMVASLWRRFSAPGLAMFFRQYACEALGLTPDEFALLVGVASATPVDHSLRACPCCGSDAQIEAHDDGHRVRCCNSECGMATPVKTNIESCRNLWSRRERPKLRQTNKKNEKID
ncbi:MAG: DNA primase [Sulfuricella sp.]|nr:DNA primase [Sulfuricella sp.]